MNGPPQRDSVIVALDYLRRAIALKIVRQTVCAVVSRSNAISNRMKKRMWSSLGLIFQGPDHRSLL